MDINNGDNFMQQYFGEMQLNDIFKQGHNFTFSRLVDIDFDNYTISLEKIFITNEKPW